MAPATATIGTGVEDEMATEARRGASETGMTMVETRKGAAVAVEEAKAEAAEAAVVAKAVEKTAIAMTAGIDETTRALTSSKPTTCM